MKKAWKHFIYELKTNRQFSLGVFIISIMLILVIFAPLIAPYPPEKAYPSNFLQPPSWDNLLGTDRYGMDIFSRIVYSPRIDLVIAFGATFFSLIIGVPLGVWAGYVSGRKGIQDRLQEYVLRFMDILQSFPAFVLAMAFVAALGPSVFNVMAVIAFINIPVFLRLTRSAVLTEKHRAYIDAAICSGNSDFRIILKYLLPNTLSPALINASVVMGFAVLLTAGLSFVGAGIPVPEPELGSMISIGAQNMITGEYWTSLFPGIALGLMVLGFALVGDGLRNLLNPTKRR